MDLRDVVVGPLKVLLVVGVLSLAFVGFVNFIVPGSVASFSLGYSMCGLNSPHYDFFSLQNTTCSISPGDILVSVRVPPKVGDAVCVNTTVGMICHRAYKVDKNGICIVGDAARWRACYPWSSYVGEVVWKIPRSVAMPGVMLWGALRGDFDVVHLVDSGSYVLSRS